MKLAIVAGTRPNFIKIAPIIKELDKAISIGTDIHYRLIHTGQHYDKNMSSDFFEELNLPAPDCNLECGGGTQAEQTASIMIKFEKELLYNRPDMVILVGDVNSTMACAITAKKMSILTAHVEAGIRSGDMSMPEEINRIVTDSISDIFYTTTSEAGANLKKQNILENQIKFVGNTMIDTLYQNINRIKKPDFWEKYELVSKGYFILTLHRPSNVDDPSNLYTLLETISISVKTVPVIFPVHPRTKKILENNSINFKNIIIVDPQIYLSFLYLINNAVGLITDSGGITEEATVLNIPCMTLRNNTERPETVNLGTNELIGNDFLKLKSCIEIILSGKWKQTNIPKYWDGNTSKRIVLDILESYASLVRSEKDF